MQTLINRTALVTGGNSGIGYAAAKALAGSGAQVIITGRRKPAVGKAASELGAVGMIADQANVTDITALAQTRVNSVSPGPFSTAIMEKAGLGHPDTQHFIIAGVPLARLGVPEEAGNLIRFLAGDDAAYITGADFLIDGGQSLNK